MRYWSSRRSPRLALRRLTRRLRRTTTRYPDWFNPELPQVKHVVLADMNTGFTASMLSTDNVHPNKSGYDFMGDKWYELIGELLPQ